MSSEIIIYPKNPYELTWESYISEYPIHMSNIESEECKLKDEINDIKNKIFGLVGAVPRDICNENDDPFEYVTDKIKSLLSDYKFIVGRLWKLSMIERFGSLGDHISGFVEYMPRMNINVTAQLKKIMMLSICW